MNITSKAMSICLFVRPSVRYYVSLTYSALDSTTRKYLSKISIHKSVFLFHNNNNICQHVFLHKIIRKWVNISIKSKVMSVCLSILHATKAVSPPPPSPFSSSLDQVWWRPKGAWKLVTITIYIHTHHMLQLWGNCVALQGPQSCTGNSVLHR